MFTKKLKIDISVEKTKIKFFLITYSTLDGISNDTTHNPLEPLDRSAKIDCTKMPISAYSYSSIKVGRNKNISAVTN